MKMMDANEIISFIQNSKKSTPVKVYIKGDLDGYRLRKQILKPLSMEIRELSLVNGLI